MSDSELSFSIREIAYAMNIEVHEAQIYGRRIVKKRYKNKRVLQLCKRKRKDTHLWK